MKNDTQRWNPDTGKPLYPEYRLAGQETLYDIELTDKNRKQIIDSVIGDNYPENIQWYYKGDGIRDASFSYEDFVKYDNSGLRNLSKRGGGSRGSPYYKDKDGKLRKTADDSLV